MWRHLASNALSFFFVLLLVVAGAVAWGARMYSEPGPLEAGICLRVESGTNFRAVSRNLEAQGAVASGAILRIGADYSQRAGLLKAGSYLVPERASMEEIVEIVTRGGQSTCGTEVVYRIGVNKTVVQVRELDPATSRYVDVVEYDPVTDETPSEYTKVAGEADTRFRVGMAEGTTSWQVVTALNGISTLVGPVLEVPAEGMLAPDSYEFRPGATVASILARMEASQEQILAEAWVERAADLPVSTPQEALVLASIIEKETGVAEERGLVAGVFVNRLNRGIRLQTDPTVIYGITGGEGVLGRGLRQSELQRETPYNTYLIDGLPPTPIANPGRASIEAALNPADTPFIFFVADGTGGHAFADNLADHNKNVAAWRAIEDQQTGN